jgi:hypothetical protein
VVVVAVVASAVITATLTWVAIVIMVTVIAMAVVMVPASVTTAVVTIIATAVITIVTTTSRGARGCSRGSSLSLLSRGLSGNPSTIAVNRVRVIAGLEDTEDRLVTLNLSSLSREGRKRQEHNRPGHRKHTHH